MPFENSAMDFSRENQTSTNIFEFEESAEVRNDAKSYSRPRQLDFSKYM